MRPTRMSWRSSVLQPLALKFLSCRHRLPSCVPRLRRSSAPLAKSSNATFPTRRRFTHDVAGGCRRVSGGSTTPTVLSACWAFDAQRTSAACWKRYARTADCRSPIGLRSDRLKKVPPDTAPAAPGALTSAIGLARSTDPARLCLSRSELQAPPRSLTRPHLRPVPPISQTASGSTAVMEYRPTETLPLLGAMLLDFARLCRRCRPAWPPKWRKTWASPGAEGEIRRETDCLLE